MLEWLENLLAGIADALTDSLLPAVLLLVCGVLIIRIVNKLVRSALEKTRLEKAAYSLILSVVNTVLYVLLGLIVAARLGVDVTSVVALASVLTLAVSLALQNMLTNVIGGFTILSTNPFRSGDYVEIAGQAGTVSEINMTYTRLVTPDNKLISIPNSAVVAAQIVNYSAQPTRRVAVDVSAPYTVPAQEVLGALLEAGQVDRVLPEPAPFAAILGYGESNIQYSLRVWVRSGDYWDVFFAVNRNVKKVFEEKGICAPYPHVNVHLDK